MDKFEKIIEMPSSFINRETSNDITRKIYNVAEEQAYFDYIEVLRQFAPNLGLTPNQAIEQHKDNVELRGHIAIRKDKTIFISQYKNVEYAGRNVAYDEIPIDVNQVIINIPGVDGKLISVFVTNDLIKSHPLHKINNILIQGYNETWVNGLYNELLESLKNSKKPFRNLIYRFFRLFSFIAFICLSFLELKVLNVASPSFTFYTPLNGLSSIFTFMILIMNYYLAVFFGGNLMQYFYPYIEFEDRVSQSKKDFRWLFNLSVGAIYAGGVWAMISTFMAFL